VIFYMTELKVSDLQRSLSWYQTVLCFEVELVDHRTGFALLKDSQEHRLALKEADSPSSDVLIHFQVANLEAERERLQSLDVALLDNLKTSEEGYRRLLIHDPDGHQITIFEWTAQ
jgi:catechol 2,3-dioxygenase-like lactoylglutathione lyase family enzyme